VPVQALFIYVGMITDNAGDAAMGAISDPNIIWAVIGIGVITLIALLVYVFGISKKQLPIMLAEEAAEAAKAREEDEEAEFLAESELSIGDDVGEVGKRRKS
jgi:hypothetical protein